MVRDDLFIPIENVDYDCLISTGKCISAQSDKNMDLLVNDNMPQGLEQALMSAHRQSHSNNESVAQNDQNDRDVPDKEDLSSFVIGHSEASDSGAIKTYNNMPVS